MSYEASIVILSYNNYESTTGPCLESLFNDHENGLFEIVVVDNASGDKTPEMLKMYSAQKSNLKPVLNSINRGFAGGNNDGVKNIESDIVILLNSDTIVPAGSIGKIVSHFKDNPEWGMLGPVTNAAGNEQKIFISADDPENGIIEGERFCSHSENDCFRTERIDFFCAAMRRDVYENLGGLDEQFGLGYYEDLDFSVRAYRAGIKMMIAEDCFIYHSAGKTFSKVGKKNVRKLMHENKKKLKKKFSGNVKLFRLRDRNIKMMKEYINLKSMSDRSRSSDLDYKFNNRLLLAGEIYPHSPIKKMIYGYMIKRLGAAYREA